jgi:hypothetical protein
MLNFGEAQYGEVPLIGQPVEKVGVELVATTNRVLKPPKTAYLVPDLE